MEHISEISIVLDNILSDSQVLRDARQILDAATGHEFEIADGVSVTVPNESSLTVVAKSVVLRRQRFGLGVYCAYVGIGLVTEMEVGPLAADCFFFVLRYNEHAELITFDIEQYL